MGKVQAHLAEHGTTWFAHYQNAGKGQRGKQWNAERSQNIMMSCVLEPYTLLVDDQFILNAAITLGCFDFFNENAIDCTSIKWPNDIYWRDRKAGGILIENVLKGEKWKYSVVGIGLNINQTLFPGKLRNPVSLKQITGKAFNVIALAKELCSHLERRWKQLLLPDNNTLIEEYNQHLYKINQLAFFKKGEEEFSAFVKGVNRKGELLVEKENNSIEGYHSLEWVLP
ncbi:MAG: biotin--[acetyl-CoA-carboxylase] ligase [Bacteroidota bacterium]|nr:biotin--[acetyl-CoA-carboxylase] ligase [Bacteroidota bacterium]